MTSDPSLNLRPLRRWNVTVLPWFEIVGNAFAASGKQLPAGLPRAGVAPPRARIPPRLDADRHALAAGVGAVEDAFVTVGRSRADGDAFTGVSRATTDLGVACGDATGQEDMRTLYGANSSSRAWSARSPPSRQKSRHSLALRGLTDCG